MPMVNVRGCDFHYREAGHGRTILLLHGFPLDSRIWLEQMQGLCDECRVIALDQHGFGQSACDDPFTIESLADDVHAVMTALNVRPCMLAGLSMGGYVALAYVRKYPTDLRGLVLADTKAEADSTDARRNRMRMVEVVRQQGARAIADEMLPRMFTERTLLTRPELVARLRQIMEQCPPRTIERALRAMHDREDYRADLASMAVPTLAIVGEHDRLSTPETMRWMVQEMPAAELAVVPGAAHVTSMESPQAFNNVVRAFVRKVNAMCP